MKKIIYTKNAPEPVGPYSQAVKIGDFLFLSGQIALDPNNGMLVAGGIENETRQVLVNICEVLKEAGYVTGDVVKTEIFMVDLADFGKVNDIYGEYFGDSKPARFTVGVASLPKGALIEIAVMAAKDTK